MALRGHPAGSLSFEKSGSDLYRQTSEGRRPVLRAVTTFRWRRYGGSIEVDLRYQVTRGWGLLAAGGARELPIPEERRLTFRVTPRSGGSSQW